MEREEMLYILNGMCERSLMNGLIKTLEGAKTIYSVFNRFSSNNYINDKEYSDDILYFYNLAVELHTKGYTSLEESYSIYNAILCADRVDFVDTSNSVQFDIDDIEQDETEVIKGKPVKIKKNKKHVEDDVVIDISDIVVS